MRILHATPPAVAALLLLVAACGGPTANQAAKERDRLASTATTGALIAAAWDTAAVPGVYASHSIRKLGADVQATASAPVWQALGRQEQQQVRAILTAMAGTLSSLDSAITRQDRAAVAGGRRRLDRDRQSLAAVRIDTSGT